MDGIGNIQRIMEHQFQFTFRTGNVIIDTLIAGLIITTTSYLFKSFKNISMDCDFFLSLVGFGHNKIIITGKPVKSNPTNQMEKAEFSTRFNAVLHQVKQAGYSNSGVHQLVEGTDCETNQFIVAQTTTFMLDPEIYCKIIQDSKQQETFRDATNTPATFRAEVSSKTKNVEELEKLIESWIKEYTLFVQETGENRIELTGSLNDINQSFDFSNKFLAVLHKMNSLNYNLPYIKVLKELHLQEPKDRYIDRYSDNQTQDEKRNADNLVPEVCQIENNVYCRVEKTQNNSKTEMSIKISSQVLNVQELSELLHTWEKEYDEHNQVKVGLKYFVFNPTNENSRNPSNFTEFSFESVKSFKNVFFPEKENLVENIDFFQKNETWFTERGIPYTLGILFHGEPGCGKTSTIKAIANMTQRHIISVPLKNVKTTSELYNIFYGVKVNRRSIAMDKRLYVLEDIDCGGLEDIVNNRIKDDQLDEDNEEDLKKDDSNQKKYYTMSDILEEKNGKKKEEKEKVKELTLSDLLEVFDGVMESKGRMMVITTNHLNKLDPALIRPGRVDTCLQFRKCSPDAIMSIFNNFYGKENIPEGFDSEQVPDDTWTPAEVVQIFVKNSTKPLHGLKVICAEK